MDNQTPDLQQRKIKAGPFVIVIIGLALVGIAIVLATTLVEKKEQAPAGVRIATLASQHGQVKQRPETSLDWDSAKTSQTFFDGHRVRTMESSGAKVRFDTGQIMQIGAGTQVTLRSKPAHAGSTAVLDVSIHDEGDVRIDSGDSAQDVIIRLHEATGGELAQLDTRENKSFDVGFVVRPDKAYSIAVYDTGQKNLAVKIRGRTMSFGQGQGSLVSPGAEADATVVSIPGAPASVTQQPPSADGSPLTVVWEQVTDAIEYEIALARDQVFTDIVRRDRVSDLSYDADVDGGVYFVQVTPYNAQGIAGQPSPVRKVVVELAPTPTPEESPVAQASPAATATPVSATTAVAEKTPAATETVQATPMATATAAAKATPAPEATPAATATHVTQATPAPKKGLSATRVGSKVVVSGSVASTVSMVMVQGRPVEVKNGEFEAKLGTLAPGTKRVTVQLIHSTGKIEDKVVALP
jgi:hypothetical protein